ncbi:MAG: hypothetical protein KAR20_01125, partial [Candidatus Heimdallarchaeota archaeon]|nr:hypothetical protein [Candidatus Heimdallarchaeota archaeon]
MNLAKRQNTEEQARELLSIISRDILDYHLKLAKKAEESYWASGELSLELIEKYYPEYSKAAIRKFVGEIYSIGMNTVRDRERVATAVPKKLRDKIPFLKSSHWRCIVPLERNKAQDIVFQSVAMFQAEKKGPTVDQMKAWTGSKGTRTALPWMYRNETALEKMEMVRDDHFADPEIRL